MLTRRDFYRAGSVALGSLMGLVLAVPGAAYLLDPLRRKAGGVTSYPLARLSDLPVGVPRAFAIVDERKDAWVTYPKRPIGTVWLVRRPEGSETPVVAYQAECPHLGCVIGADHGGTSFRCPCHGATFAIDGSSTNGVSPRSMDYLEVEVLSDANSTVSVRYQRFRPQATKRLPLA
ncbi:Rieske (2Fe-2S) protein [Isosphaeraceae bacterium EP7]